MCNSFSGRECAPVLDAVFLLVCALLALLRGRLCLSMGCIGETTPSNHRFKDALSELKSGLGRFASLL